MRSWTVTVDRYVEVDGQRQPKRDVRYLSARILADAIENALDDLGLMHEESGEFQITATVAA